MRVVSHPGATFGGLVHDGSLAGERVLDALTAMVAVYAERGLRSLSYKAVPWIYHRVPSNDDLYALFCLDATRRQVDLSCAIDLAERRPPSRRRRRGAKKARARGLAISDSIELVPEFWRLLEGNLASRHGVEPVHSLDEIMLLRELFPDRVSFALGSLDGEVVAGAVLFGNDRVAHVQYNAASDTGRAIGATDALFEHCIEEAGEAGRRFFDFGISTESKGRRLNRGLYLFKHEFGAGGVSYETYDVAI
jgi:Acetyltransferase (GNAT) domain